MLVCASQLGAPQPAAAGNFWTWLLGGSEPTYVSLEGPGAAISMAVVCPEIDSSGNVTFREEFFPIKVVGGDGTRPCVYNSSIPVKSGKILYLTICPKWANGEIGKVVIFFDGRPISIVKAKPNENPRDVFDRVLRAAVRGYDGECPRDTVRQVAYGTTEGTYYRLAINTGRLDPVGGHRVEVCTEQRGKPGLKGSETAEFRVVEPLYSETVEYRDVTGTPGAGAVSDPPATDPPSGGQSGPVQPTVSQTAMSRISAYGLVPDNLGTSHEFASTGARGVRIPFVASLLDRTGNPDSASRFYAVIVDSAGKHYTKDANYQDGIICLDRLGVGSQIRLFANGVEITKTMEGNPLPIVTRAGIGNLVLVQGGM